MGKKKKIDRELERALMHPTFMDRVAARGIDTANMPLPDSEFGSEGAILRAALDEMVAKKLRQTQLMEQHEKPWEIIHQEELDTPLRYEQRRRDPDAWRQMLIQSLKEKRKFGFDQPLPFPSRVVKPYDIQEF